MRPPKAARSAGRLLLETRCRRCWSWTKSIPTIAGRGTPWRRRHDGHHGPHDADAPPGWRSSSPRRSRNLRCPSYQQWSATIAVPAEWSMCWCPPASVHRARQAVATRHCSDRAATGGLVAGEPGSNRAIRSRSILSCFTILGAGMGEPGATASRRFDGKSVLNGAARAQPAAKI